MSARKFAQLLVVFVACLCGMAVDVAQVTDGFQVHVTCPEGGEELHVAPAHIAPHRSEVRGVNPAAHKGCPLAEQGPLPSPQPVTAPSVQSLIASVPLEPAMVAFLAAPPACPLVNAPKTSPPQVS